MQSFPTPHHYTRQIHPYSFTCAFECENSSKAVLLHIAAINLRCKYTWTLSSSSAHALHSQLCTAIIIVFKCYNYSTSNAANDEKMIIAIFNMLAKLQRAQQTIHWPMLLLLDFKTCALHGNESYALSTYTADYTEWTNSLWINFERPYLSSAALFS